MKMTFVGVLALAAGTAVGQLYENGPVFDNPGPPPLSVIDVGGTLFGFGQQITANNAMADNFSSTDPWSVTGLTFYAYQTGATGFTYTQLNYQIASSHDDAISWTSVALDNSNNGGLVAYRVSQTAQTDRNRPIFAITIPTNIDLPAGSYVLRWSLAGTLASGPWQPYVPGSRGSGNARQSLANGAFTDALDNTLGVELPFRIDGTVVPAPGAAALLGLGALVGLRRRR